MPASTEAGTSQQHMYSDEAADRGQDSRALCTGRHRQQWERDR